ncbi:DUF1273 domain-containing protein [Metabacillus herbersteinensis]|uniref:UPF0398 protein ACFFIX_09330 n=1 Tax=Metabacillus herbersteinensis TaxID=283816 RepID=A0ABV6GDA6_9BACI
MKVLTISGYKPFELGIFKNDDEGVFFIKKAIEKSLISLLNDGLEWVIISGQLGIELWAAEVVLSLQISYPEVKLGIITPFLNQESNWKEDNKEFYESILLQANFVDSITRREYDSPQQFRLKNQFFLDKSDALLLVYDNEKPGSPKYLFELAQKKQEVEEYPLFLIDFYDLQLIVEEENIKREIDNYQDF